jgi:putative endonuclease
VASFGVEKHFYVYMLASDRNGTIYVGVTSQLLQRVWQHKEKFVDGFTKQYGVDKLVWYERHETAESAITREKRIKKWNRDWKIRLIEEANPYWNDLSLALTA